MSQMKVNCDECKNEFILNPVDIKEDTVEIYGVNAILVYFTCPKCNRIYRISIQDKRYYELKEDLEKTKKRIRNNHGSNNDEKARVLNAMVVKKHERLKAYVDKVNKTFSGTFTFEVSKNNPKEKHIKYLP